MKYIWYAAIALGLWWLFQKATGYAPGGSTSQGTTTGNWIYEVEVGGNRQILTVAYPPDNYLPVMAKNNIKVLNYRRA